jgi:phosphate-selective porin OprO and OprP
MRIALLAATALYAVAALPVQAGEKEALKAQIEALKKQIAAQQQQLDELSAQVQDVKVATVNQFADERRTREEGPKLAIKDARPTFTSGDGKSSISLRGRLSLDYANYFQDRDGPLATDFRRGSFGDATEASRARDLNDGTNFRRAQIGVEGKLDDVWQYSLIYEFGGTGQEDGGRIQDLYLQYSGIENVRLRAGAFGPSVGYDDSISNAESLFLERASPAELQRQIAGAEGRTGIAAYTNGEEWFGSIAVTGAPIATQSFDEQLALVGRVAFLPIKTPDFNVHIGANATYLFRAPDQGPDVAQRYPFRLRDRPEIRVDSTRLIDTGNINTDKLLAPGVEFAANFQNFYVQGEYIWYQFERELGGALPDPDFSGWYVQAAWALTGETRTWNAANGVFSGLKPAKPLDLKGDGWGALELAARYSVSDLNYRADLLPAAGGIRGGEQTALTLGLNWYVNNNVRFLLDYQWVEVDRLSTGAANAYGTGVFVPPAGAQIGQDLEIVSIRTQFTF